MPSLPVGIIGGGWIARRHVSALVAAAGVELVVAACDSDLVRAQAVAGPRGATAYERWEEMLERGSLDAVWVCTPPLSHREPVVRALEAGIHVYLEKPIARTLTDAKAIVAGAAASEAICAVGHQWHATELLDTVREATAGQTIGMLVGRNYGPVAVRPWSMDRGQGGGQILERGSHHVDLQRAIAGEIATGEAVIGGVMLAHSGDARGNIDLRVESTDPFDRSVTRFLEVARSGGRSRVFCTPEDALLTLAVGLSCERALAERGPVAVASQ